MDRINQQFDTLMPFRINQLSAGDQLTGQRVLQRAV